MQLLCKKRRLEWHGRSYHVEPVSDKKRVATEEDEGADEGDEGDEGADEGEPEVAAVMNSREGDAAEDYDDDEADASAKVD